jgi:membrane-associated PAP2 superfamily phosphatase
MPHTATSSAAAAPLSTRAVPLTRWWLIALGLTLLWDWMGADLAVMQLIGSPSGFALRDQWLLSRVLHDAVRQAAVLFYLLIWVWAAWPARWQRGPAALWTLPRRERLVIAVLIALSLLAVNLIKNASQTSCPWDLNAFGGPAQYVSHWSLGLRDGGSGRCFPGGHASSAYAFLGLCLPWLMPPAGRSRAPAAGWRWLNAWLIAGAVAGAVQTVRGAHYPSHTLWTLVICAGVSLAGWKLMNHPLRAARAPL